MSSLHTVESLDSRNEKYYCTIINVIGVLYVFVFF